jgi:hypothetical protein
MEYYKVYTPPCIISLVFRFIYVKRTHCLFFFLGVERKKEMKKVDDVVLNGYHVLFAWHGREQVSNPLGENYIPCVHLSHSPIQLCNPLITILNFIYIKKNSHGDFIIESTEKGLKLCCSGANMI